jgi:hypothetical protein
VYPISEVKLKVMYALYSCLALNPGKIELGEEVAQKEKRLFKRRRDGSIKRSGSSMVAGTAN